MPVLSKEFLDIQANIECTFTLKCGRDMVRTYNPLHNFHFQDFLPCFGHKVQCGRYNSYYYGETDQALESKV